MPREKKFDSPTKNAISMMKRQPGESRAFAACSIIEDNRQQGYIIFSHNKKKRAVEIKGELIEFLESEKLDTENYIYGDASLSPNNEGILHLYIQGKKGMSGDHVKAWTSKILSNIGAEIKETEIHRSGESSGDEHNNSPSELETSGNLHASVINLKISKLMELLNIMMLSASKSEDKEFFKKIDVLSKRLGEIENLVRAGSNKGEILAALEKVDISIRQHASDFKRQIEISKKVAQQNELKRERALVLEGLCMRANNIVHEAKRRGLIIIASSAEDVIGNIDQIANLPKSEATESDLQFYKIKLEELEKMLRFTKINLSKHAEKYLIVAEDLYTNIINFISIANKSGNNQAVEWVTPHKIFVEKIIQGSNLVGYPISDLNAISEKLKKYADNINSKIKMDKLMNNSRGYMEAIDLMIKDCAKINRDAMSYDCAHLIEDYLLPLENNLKEKLLRGPMAMDISSADLIEIHNKIISIKKIVDAHAKVNQKISMEEDDDDESEDDEDESEDDEDESDRMSE